MAELEKYIMRYFLYLNRQGPILGVSMNDHMT